MGGSNNRKNLELPTGSREGRSELEPLDPEVFRLLEEARRLATAIGHYVQYEKDDPKRARKLRSQAEQFLNHLTDVLGKRGQLQEIF